MFSGVLPRLLTAALYIPLVLTMVLVQSLSVVFLLFCTVLAVLGMQEFCSIVKAKGIVPEKVCGMFSCAAIMLSAYAGSLDITAMVFFTGAALTAWVHILRGTWSLHGLLASVFGVFYAGWLPAHFVLLHRFPEIGPGLIIVLCVGVMCSDAGAYFVGKSFGKHKLAVKASPNKTWEGAIGGVAAAVIGAALLYGLRALFDWQCYPQWRLMAYVLSCAALAVVSQIGDLVESVLKRGAGVKDSGMFFPGHGGVLDRCDGLLFAAPMLYYLTAIGEV